MTEDFLHYIWKFRKFDFIDLKTTGGEEITLVDNGFHNFNSGPDFQNARLYIGRQLWAGNVEIHLRSSDWYRHKHQLDKTYQNVILHVVYEDDQIVTNDKGANIPTLILKGRFDENLYWQYEHLLNNKTIIPCASQLMGVDEFIRENMMERVLVERMEDKSKIISALLKSNNGDWNETFYQWIARAFGLKINADPMLTLAQQISASVLAKHRSQLQQIEALLFGGAGFLQHPSDDYSHYLAKEFKYLKQKYRLNEMDPSLWKFSRLRPTAFPTLRIAQLAAFIEKQESLMAKFLKTGEIDQIREMFEITPSDYWKNHYRFGKSVKPISGKMGSVFIEGIIINVLVPFLFVYGNLRDEAFYRQRAMDILDQIKSEENSISKLYAGLNFPMKTAFHSQASIQLNTNYCKPKKCLNCAIGIQLLSHD